jgi:[NiFe] hydrogenase assembly HybE family chaperone
MAHEDKRCQDLSERLVALYRAIHANAMRDVPVCNEALVVEAVGFHRHEGHALGILITPWFMNLARTELEGGLPLPPAQRGSTLNLVLPAGPIDLVVGELDGFGRIDACSLFSPMFDFADAEAAHQTAEAVLAVLFNPAVLAEGTQTETRMHVAKPLDRRMLLRGGLRSRGEAAGA